MSVRMLLVDDEEPELRNLSYATKRASADSEIVCMKDPCKALTFFKENPADVVMVDVRMPTMSGIEFAQEIRKIKEQTNIIFVTAYSEYAMDAFEQHASGYLLKPVRVAAVEKELANLRYPIVQEEKTQPLMKTVCFGEFRVYVNEEKIHFKRAYEKEILAYLVANHGKGVNTDDILNALWQNPEEREKRRDYLRVLYSGLRKTLESCGCRDVLIKRTNYFAVNPAKMDCDYFRLLAGDKTTAESFDGTFMESYAWADDVRQQAEQKAFEILNKKK